MKIIITFYITKNLGAMKKNWTKNTSLKKQGIYGTNKPIGRHVNLGGLIVKFDWSNKKEIITKEIRCPSGFDFKNNLMYVASMRRNKIYILNQQLNIVGEINNKYFNDIHSLNFTKKGFLVTSSGLDLILEIDCKGKILWNWWGIENGYSNTPLNKKRKINKNIDNRRIDYPTLKQTTHVSSAIFFDKTEKKIIASLFHQGKVIEINKSSSKTKTILEELKQPHSIYKFGTGFIVSDTNNNRIILFRKNGKILNEICGGFDWIQDCTELSNGNYLVADSNNNRIVEINGKGKILDSYNYNKNFKIYQIKEIAN